MAASFTVRHWRLAAGERREDIKAVSGPELDVAMHADFVLQVTAAGEHLVKPWVCRTKLLEHRSEGTGLGLRTVTSGGRPCGREEVHLNQTVSHKNSVRVVGRVVECPHGIAELICGAR